jgi:hypothetical protein
MERGQRQQQQHHHHTLLQLSSSPPRASVAPHQPPTTPLGHRLPLGLFFTRATRFRCGSVCKYASFPHCKIVTIFTYTQWPSTSPPKTPSPTWYMAIPNTTTSFMHHIHPLPLPPLGALHARQGLHRTRCTSRPQVKHCTENPKPQTPKPDPQTLNPNPQPPPQRPSRP